MRPTWILNLDAERELRRGGGPHYTTPAAVGRQMLAQRERLVALTEGDESRFVSELQPGEGLGRSALCWCPTPSALGAAARAGYALTSTPPVEVLRRVTSRAHLAAADWAELPGRDFVSSPAELERALAPVRAGKPLRAKPAYSFAGRGQRTLRAERLDEDLRYLLDALRHGGVLLEPELAPCAEWSIHGVVGPRAEPLLGRVCRQWVDEFGQPLRIEAAPPERSRDERLLELGAAAARSLAAAGYFGAFGLDVLELEGGQRIASDLNARFTLGWSTGLGPRRDEALRRLLDSDASSQP